MSELNDPKYYAARAAKARTLAEAATDQYIAALHRRMADSYSVLAQYEAGGRPSLAAMGD